MLGYTAGYSVTECLFKVETFLDQCHAYADPESFIRGGPILTKFMRDGHYKAGHHRPASETFGVSLACR